MEHNANFLRHFWRCGLFIYSSPASQANFSSRRRIIIIMALSAEAQRRQGRMKGTHPQARTKLIEKQSQEKVCPNLLAQQAIVIYLAHMHGEKKLYRHTHTQIIPASWWEGQPPGLGRRRRHNVFRGTPFLSPLHTCLHARAGKINTEETRRLCPGRKEQLLQNRSAAAAGGKKVSEALCVSKTLTRQHAASRWRFYFNSSRHHALLAPELTFIHLIGPSTLNLYSLLILALIRTETRAVDSNLGALLTHQELYERRWAAT